MNNPKVILIQEELKNYRDPIYAIINQYVDLTVGYTKTADFQKSSYPIISLPYKMIGPIIWHKGIRKIINQYDAVVFVPHFRMIRVATLPFIPHKPKLVTWSLGVHASYTRLYDLSKKPDWEDRLFEAIQDKADACVFYMPEPIEYWKKYKGIDESKYFVAHNTVAVAPYEEVNPDKRNLILFVGTLYKQKGIGELIECYAKAKERVGKLPALKIIGKGPEKDIIQQQIIDLKLESEVELTGAIYDENILKNYFIKSIICVSPKQAGLTVLKSFGYGVPFVTRIDAISGGEKSNIIDGENGYFYETKDKLVELLVKTVTEPKKYAVMSKAAHKYYQEEASPEKMAEGVLKAIHYALES